MKKKLLALAAVVAVLAIIAVGTAAYFTSSETAHNVITTGGVDIELVETAIGADGETVPFENMTNVVPNTAVSKIVEVKNTGESTAYVRVRVEKAIALAETATPADGEMPEADLDLVQIDFNETDWTQQDGWYYYNKPLASGESTTPLFTEVYFAADMSNLYQNSTATIDVAAQAVQSANNGGSALEAAGWPET